jgi:hypothetical protein
LGPKYRLLTLILFFCHGHILPLYFSNLSHIYTRREQLHESLVKSLRHCSGVGRRRRTMAYNASHPYHAAESYAEPRREYHHQHPHPFRNNSDTNLHDSSSKSSFYANGNLPSSIACDIKPRLTKEQHDILESHYQKQPKPNTNTKKGFAENLQVSLDKVNVSGAVSSCCAGLRC